MNLFLPYVDDVERSIRCLDDVRLRKQIVECKVMMNVFNGAKGYSQHPIVKHYTQTKRQFKFVRYYAWLCCEEYKYRFNKEHAYTSLFPKTKYFGGVPGYTPVYLEGSPGDSKYIYTNNHEKVSELYQKKLIRKWHNDKKTPIWTKRSIPLFYL